MTLSGPLHVLNTCNSVFCGPGTLLNILCGLALSLTSAYGLVHNTNVISPVYTWSSNRFQSTSSHKAGSNPPIDVD